MTVLKTPDTLTHTMTHRVKLVSLMVILMTLIGCAGISQDAQYNRVKDLKGKTETQVVDKLGIPDDTYMTGNKKYLEYEGDNSCISRFTLVNKVVESITVTGDYCSLI